jgi:hypothetical protein
VKATAKTLRALLLLVGAALAILYVHTKAQVVTPRPEELRYQVLLTEPIASPDRRSVVAGTSALLIKDRVSGQCFLAVTVGASVGLSPATCAP